ncbi:MAG: ribbon-helix-helix protein, CopG family [Sulfolobales archaeon]
MGVKVVTVKMKEDLLNQLDRYALQMGMNRSEVIRSALKIMLNNGFEKKDSDKSRIMNMSNNESNEGFRRRYISITI